MGRTHAKAFPEQTLRHELIDIVFTGWGEHALVNVLTRIRSGCDLRDVPVILLKIDGKIISTGIPIRYDPAKLPAFPFHLIQIEKYINPLTRALNYTSSCGCPGSCSFCPWNGHHSWESLPTKRVLDDIEWLVKTYRPRTVWLSEANFFANKKYVIDFGEGLHHRKIDIYWYALARVVDLLKFSRDELKKLEQTGLNEILLGVEQTSESMKKLLNKTFKLNNLDLILERTKGLNIKMRLSFLCGLPNETIADLEDIYLNIKRWRSINPNIVAQANQYQPYPGSSLYKLALSKGLTAPDTLAEWATADLLRVPYTKSRDQHNVWNDVPWFDSALNKEYGEMYLKYFPRAEGLLFKEAKLKSV